jgi:aryl-alcohol dehydrogenase-like predicted oxidoreductase
MEKRKLGALSVSALGLGCMGMSQIYGPADEAESLRTLDRALELGIDFLDTSDIYGFGHNEELLGGWLKGKRGKVVLATKFGNVRTPDGKMDVDGRPEHVRQACEASLKRLGVEVIDLYYQHRVDPKVPIEETVGAMAALVKAGMVRALGLSEAGPATIRRAHRTHPIAALQSEYSLWTRDLEAEILPTCRELGIGFVAYAPLGRGFLSARITKPEDLAEGDRRREHPRYAPENMARNLRLLDKLQGLARAKGATPAQIAIAWLLARGRDVVPIPGTKRRAYLEENAGATALALTGAEVAELERAFPVGVTSGQRYPTAQLARVGI